MIQMTIRSRVIEVLDICSEARYYHRVAKVADSPTKTNLDFVPNSLRKRKRRANMAKLINPNGEYLR